MKSIISIATLLTLTSALTINKPRQSAYSYTVTTNESNGVQQALYPDPNGIVAARFNPSQSDFLTSASIDNPADDVQCTLRDTWGNQVRAFGGPNQDVDSVELVMADGIQVFTIYCAPA